MFNITTDTTAILTDPVLADPILTDAEIDAIVCAEVQQMSYVEEELATFIGRLDTLADALHDEEAELLV